MSCSFTFPPPFIRRVSGQIASLATIDKLRNKQVRQMGWVFAVKLTDRCKTNLPDGMLQSVLVFTRLSQLYAALI